MELTELLGRLTDGVRDDGERAGVIVLTSMPYLAGRHDVVDRWYLPADRPGHPAALVVDWHRMTADLNDRAVPVSDGERAALRVAASMAYGMPCDLRAMFTHLDPTIAAAVLAALYTLGGGRGDLVNDHHRFAGQEERA